MEIRRQLDRFIKNKVCNINGYHHKETSKNRGKERTLRYSRKKKLINMCKRKSRNRRLGFRLRTVRIQEDK